MDHRIATILLPTLLAASPVAATTVLPPQNLGEMVRISDATVYAEAESVRVEAADRGMVVTLTRFRTLATVAGSPRVRSPPDAAAAATARVRR